MSTVLAALVVAIVLHAAFAVDTFYSSHDVTDRVTSLALNRVGAAHDAPAAGALRFKPPILAHAVPSEHDLDLLPIAIVASVDGRFHALNRTDGRIKWSMTPDQLYADLPTELSPLVRTKQSNPEGEDDDSLETYIIEPQTGDIYVLPGQATAADTLQKLPISMEQLVELSPFSLPDDKSRIFIGKKETALLVIDLETGKIQSLINSDRECIWRTQDLHTPLEEAHLDYDDQDGSRLPRPKRPLEISIGRTDYYVTVHTRGSPVKQNLAFSVYGPNNADRETQLRWIRTPDDKYLQPSPNGELWAFNTASDPPLWVLESLGQPIVAVFDLVAVKGRADPLALLQPRPRIDEVLRRGHAHYDEHADRTYVGMVDNSLFAMSAHTFPLVAFMDDLAATHHLPDAATGDGLSSRNHECESHECLVGTWRTFSSQQSRLGRLLPAPSSEVGRPTPSSDSSDKPNTSFIVDIPDNARPTASRFLLITSLLSLAALGCGVCLVFIFLRRTPINLPIAVNVPAGASHEHAGEPNGAILPDNSPRMNSTEGPKPANADAEPPSVPPQTPTPPTEIKELADGSSDRDDDKEDDGLAGKRKRTRKRNRNRKGHKVSGDAKDAPENASKGEEMTGSFVKVDADVEEVPPITPLSPPPTPRPLPTSLVVSDTVLGFGSHGTVVYQGSFQGRAVAVKRLLGDFVTLATREVELLQESDDHPNVIRYFYKEHRENFLYIALELCPASLADIIERPDVFRDIAIPFDPKRALAQITAGLRHLHSLKIVHRDIKPQNILVSHAKNGVRRMLISDFGLCKKLEFDQTSFLPTTHGALAAGTVGWRAPEILRGEVKLDDTSSIDPARDDSSSRSSVGAPSSATTARRLTKSVDVFALGCLFYYTLTNADHPFGDRFERERNILKNEMCLSELDRLGEEGAEAVDLIMQMLATEPKSRPDTLDILVHPFFWTPGRRLAFLQDASDRFEIMCRDPREPPLLELERDAFDVVGADWHTRLDRVFVENLGKFRKYDGRAVQDLLRAFRNKKHHYQDLPEHVKRHLGPLPHGFLAYFTRRFPRLFLHVYHNISSTGLSREPMFRSYFELADS